MGLASSIDCNGVGNSGQTSPLTSCASACCNHRSSSHLRDVGDNENANDIVKVVDETETIIAKTRALDACSEDVVPYAVSRTLCREDNDDVPYFGIDLPELRSVSQGVRPAPKANVPYQFTVSRAEYTGQWRGHVRHGFGTQVWPDGTTYAGQWVDNLAEGKGRLLNKQGDEYIGLWVSGLANGFGVFHSATGEASYEGEWKDDLQHGSGREFWSDGSSYAGQFVQGKKVGHGIFSRSNGDAFSGLWKSNAISGPGRLKTGDGSVVSGMWNEHKLQGCGNYNWAQGHSYKGQFDDDLRNGFGIFIWDTGVRFEGWWERGKQQQGSHIFPNGSRRELGNAKT